MLSNAYQAERAAVSAICYERNVIMNFSYKLQHDRNVMDFLKNLPANAVKLDQMERMERYYFKTALFDVAEVLFAMDKLVRQYSSLEGKTGYEVAQSCRYFSDSIGRRIIKFLAYIPLLTLVLEKVRVEKCIGEGTRLEDYQFMVEHQNDVLFSGGGFCSPFVDLTDCIDYAQYAKAVNRLAEHYNDKRKGELDSAIVDYCTLMTRTGSDTDNTYELGAWYWDHMTGLERQGEGLHSVDVFLSVMNAVDASAKLQNENEEV